MTKKARKGTTTLDRMWRRFQAAEEELADARNEILRLRGVIDQHERSWQIRYDGLAERHAALEKMAVLTQQERRTANMAHGFCDALRALLKDQS